MYYSNHVPERYTKGELSMNSTTKIRKASIILSLALTAFFGLTSIQAQGMNLTVTVSGSTSTNPSSIPDGSNVIYIVDQTNGKVMVCTATLNVNYLGAVTAQCTNVGTVSTSSSVPTPTVGLSMYESPSIVYQLTVISQVWIINNSSGVISSCSSYGYVGSSPTVSCTNVATAP